MRKIIVAISLGIIALGLCSCRRDETTPAEVKEDLQQREVVFTASGKDYAVKSSDSGFDGGDVFVNEIVLSQSHYGGQTNEKSEANFA